MLPPLHPDLLRACATVMAHQDVYSPRDSYRWMRRDARRCASDDATDDEADKLSNATMLALMCYARQNIDVPDTVRTVARAILDATPNMPEQLKLARALLVTAGYTVNAIDRVTSVRTPDSNGTPLLWGEFLLGGERHTHVIVEIVGARVTVGKVEVSS